MDQNEVKMLAGLTPSRRLPVSHPSARPPVCSGGFEGYCWLMIADAEALSELVYAPPPFWPPAHGGGGECASAITLCVTMNHSSTWRLQTLYWGDFLLSAVAGCIKSVHSRHFFNVCNLPRRFARPWKVMESHGPTPGQRRANYCPLACVKLLEQQEIWDVRVRSSCSASTCSCGSADV